jgi:hypothetical protein
MKIVGGSSVVNQNVKAPKFLNGGIDHTFHIVWVGYVSLDENVSLTGQCIESFLRGGSVLMVVNHHPSSSSSKFLDNRPTNAPRGAGDKSEPVSKIHNAPHIVANTFPNAGMSLQMGGSFTGLD